MSYDDDFKAESGDDDLEEPLPIEEGVGDLDFGDDGEDDPENRYH